MPSTSAPPPVPLRIVACGQHLPSRVVTAEEIDDRLSVVPGWTERHTGVARRHYVSTETSAQLGAAAIRDMIEPQGASFTMPDLLIGASGTPQQPIPCNAALIAAELGWHGVPCFDVNATCLSFVAALQVASGLIAAGHVRRILIVCAEVASKGLNWNQHEAAGLIGDGAAAVLIERDESGDSMLLNAIMETWPEGVALTEIRGGGSRMPAMEHRQGENTDDYLFHMDGPAVFRLAAEKMGPFVDRLVGANADRWSAIDWVIPHQASLPAIRHLRRRLGIPAAKLIETIQHQGNVIAASMPLALNEAIRSGRLQRGQTVLFLGTSAGFSLGGALLRF